MKLMDYPVIRDNPFLLNKPRELETCIHVGVFASKLIKTDDRVVTV
jgi:hypothetical protein